METREKQAYEAPQLQEWGKVADLTQAGLSGTDDIILGSVVRLPPV